MDIVKFKITPKTIKIEVRNTNNYVFDFNKAIEMEKGDREVLLKLYNALELLFKKGNSISVKTIFRQIKRVFLTKLMRLESCNIKSPRR